MVVANDPSFISKKQLKTRLSPKPTSSLPPYLFTTKPAL